MFVLIQYFFKGHFIMDIVFKVFLSCLAASVLQLATAVPECKFI